MKKNKSQKRGKSFAYGGKAMVNDFLQQLSKINNMGYEAQVETAMDPTVNLLKGLGSGLANMGINMIGSGLGKLAGAGGFSGFLGNNAKTITGGLNFLNSASGMFANGGEIEDFDNPFQIGMSAFSEQEYVPEIDNLPQQQNVKTPTKINKKDLELPKAKKTNYSNLSFSNAYKLARQNGEEVFTWKGKRYTSEINTKPLSKKEIEAAPIVSNKKQQPKSTQVQQQVNNTKQTNVKSNLVNNKQVSTKPAQQTKKTSNKNIEGNYYDSKTNIIRYNGKNYTPYQFQKQLEVWDSAKYAGANTFGSPIDALQILNVARAMNGKKDTYVNKRGETGFHRTRLGILKGYKDSGEHRYQIEKGDRYYAGKPTLNDYARNKLLRGKALTGPASQYRNKYDDGGMINNPDIEVEGQEYFETPMGETGMFQGPSHEEGGIPMNVGDFNQPLEEGEIPEGTFIYPKRLKVKGKSMAKRAEDRDKRLSKIEKLFGNSLHDNILKNSLNRTKTTNNVEDSVDKEFINLMKQLKQDNQKTEQFSLGGDTRFRDFLNLEKLLESNVFPYKGNKEDSINPKTFTASTSKKEPNILNKVLGGEFGTLGDLIGIGGNLYQGYQGIRDVVNQRKTDTPNINAFKNYGKEGLATLKNNLNLLDEIKDNQLNKAQLSKNATLNRNRNNVRGLNTLRALDLATDLGYQNIINDIFANHAGQVMDANNRIASSQFDIDNRVMAGEQARDLADRQDKDNYHTNLNRARMNWGEALSRFGKNMNQIKSRNVNTNLVNQQFENVVFGSDGRIKTADGIDIFNMGDNTDVQFDKYLRKQFSEKEISQMTPEYIKNLKTVWLGGQLNPINSNTNNKGS